jgi:hypothetical protein
MKKAESIRDLIGADFKSAQVPRSAVRVPELPIFLSWEDEKPILLGSGQRQQIRGI